MKGITKITKTIASKGNMQGSGRLRPSMVAAPKPVDLPSLRKQNQGLDPSISLVPSGSCWGNINNNIINDTEDSSKSTKDEQKNPWRPSHRQNSKLSSQDFPTAAEVLKEKVKKEKPIEQKPTLGENNISEQSKFNKKSDEKNKINKTLEIEKSNINSNNPTSNDSDDVNIQKSDTPTSKSTGNNKENALSELESINTTWVDDEEMDFSEIPVFKDEIKPELLKEINEEQENNTNPNKESNNEKPNNLNGSINENESKENFIPINYENQKNIRNNNYRYDNRYNEEQERSDMYYNSPKFRNDQPQPPYYQRNNNNNNNNRFK